MALLAGSFLALLAVLLLFEDVQSLSKVLIVLWIILAAAVLGRLKVLVKDWFVFIAFLFLFDSLRGTVYVLTCRLRLPVHTLYVLNFERALFGKIPSVSLQNLLLRTDPSGHFSWLEKTLSVFYGSHFIAFLFVGLFIWIYHPGALAKYKTSFYFLVSLGTLFYALVPTAPPWMASGKFGLLPPLVRFNRVLFDSAIPILTGGFDLNPVSAMPALHAGFPILCCLLLWGLYRSKALLFYLYTLVAIFTIIYTGGHYVTDVLAGLVLAVFCLFIADRLLNGRKRGLPDGLSAKPMIPPARAELIKPVLAGLVIFLAGAGAGWVNKALVTPGVDFYDMNVPRYSDFFRNADRYKDSYPIQLYFGSYSLAWNDPRTALPYFQKSLGLARSTDERREAEKRIDVCRRALGLKE
jgi:hypothetical protein